MSGKTDAILAVDDDLRILKNLRLELAHAFPDSKILTATALSEAYALLKSPEYNMQAVVTDNSFPLFPEGQLSPQSQEEEILSMDYNEICGLSEKHDAGALLIRYIREGTVGEGYRNLPIVFESGGMDTELEQIAHQWGGFTQCVFDNHVNLGKCTANILRDYWNDKQAEPVAYEEIPSGITPGWSLKNQWDYNARYEQYCRLRVLNSITSSSEEENRLRAIAKGLEPKIVWSQAMQILDESENALRKKLAENEDKGYRR